MPALGKNIKALLFDLDGTLLNSLADLANSMNSVLQSLGYPRHDPESYRYFVGEGIERLAWKVLPAAARIPQILDRTVAAMRAEYGRRWHEFSMPYPGILELLTALASQGLKLAVFSNKPHDFATVVVRHFFPAIPFAAVLGASGETPRKPDPTGALRIAADLGIAPEAFLYLGDTATDMQTACRAGMFPVGALWGFRTAAELADNGARALLATPGELMDLL